MVADDIRRVLASSAASDLTVRRSRFLGFAAPTPDAAALRDWLADLRRAHPDARHCPHAWVAPDGAAQLSSDDGEPGDSGGRPCLAALRRARVGASAVAVVRIFGGVLLGTGNLARAYAAAASQAVEAAGVATLARWTRVAVTVAFADVGRVEQALARLGAREIARQYGDVAVLLASLPASALPELDRRIPRASWRPVGEQWR